MGAETAISWTDSTWNPSVGCTRVSEACRFCYMYRDMTRYGKDPTVVTRTKPGTFNGPLTRTRAGGFKLPGPLIFTASWTDVFHVDIDGYRSEIWDIIRRRGEIERAEGLPLSQFQVLTKRAGRIAAHLPADWGDGWPNVWLGVTMESQANVWRAEALAQVPARIRFLSYEPALGPVAWDPVLAGIHWLISGGESGGREARPSHPDWFRAARDAAARHGVAFHHKQNGEFQPLGWSCVIDGEPASGPGPCRITDGDGYPDGARDLPAWAWGDGTYAVRTGRAAAGRLLDGREHNEFPEAR